MGRKRTSYGDLGGGGAKFLDSWKKDGLIKLWLHRDPGWERRVHSFRRMEIVEGKDGPTKSIKWLPFVCMESDDFHRQRSRKDGRRPAPKICPACRIIHDLELADKLPSNEIIFEFVASRRDTRSLERGDIIGESNHRDSFKDNLSAKTEYLIYVIDPEDTSAVKILNEGYGFSKELKKRIDADIGLLGDDDGNPGKNPICYTFEYDKGPPVKYGVSRFPEAKLTKEIEDLWEMDPPDAEGFCNPGDPTPFYKAACSSITEVAEKHLDLDKIFDPSLLWWEKQSGSKKDESFDTDEMEGRAKPEERSSRRSRDEEPAERSNRTREPEKEERSSRTREPEKEERSSRARRSVEDEPSGKRETEKKPEPSNGTRSMADEMGVEVIACPDCGADWEITSHDKCGSCGLDRSKVKGKSKKDEPPEEPRESRSRTRKF